MALGIPVHSHPVLAFKRRYSSDPFYLQLSMNFGRKAEENPEPWRCKRTDGKKWRCSREALGTSNTARGTGRGERCLTKSAEMPLLTSPSYNSCSHISSSSSSYNSPPLALRLGSPYHSYDKSNVHSNGQENADGKKQDCCLVFGADLKLQKPTSSVKQSPKLQLSFVNDFPDKRNHSWMESREEFATQLSISLSLSEVISSFSPFSSCFMFSSLLKIQV